MNDLDYQEVTARRWEAATEDMDDHENYEWELLKRDYPGIPLKHFTDNFARYGKINHDDDCPTSHHHPFLPSYVGERCNSELQYFEPETCQPYPTFWNNWHD